MRTEDIYKKCAQYCSVELPADIGNRGMDYVFEMQSKVRKGLVFCGQYLPLAHQKLSEAKKKHLAAKSEAQFLIVDMLKEGKYKDSIKSYKEREKLITFEAENSCNVMDAHSAVEQLKHLHQALKDADSNLKTLKEQMSSVISLMRDEMGMSKPGSYNMTQAQPEVDTEEDLAEVKF